MTSNQIKFGGQIYNLILTPEKAKKANIEVQHLFDLNLKYQF